MTGTDLEIIPPSRPLVAGDAQRWPEVHTNARTDRDLLAVWLKSHADGSAHTRRAYGRIGERFLEAIDRIGVTLRTATVDDVQTALETMRVKADGTPASAATISTSVAAVKAFLSFAHQVGFTRFNAAPLIKVKRAPRSLAQKLMSDVDVALLIRAAKPGRDRLMIEIAYYAGLRVSELASLTFRQVIPRETGEAQFALVGKGDKPRHVLIPARLAKEIETMRAGQSQGERLFPITERRINYIIKSAAVRAGVNPDVSAHWLRHAHASHAIDAGAPITLVSQTLGHADLKTTSIYAHARPDDCSSRYLKSTMR